MFDFSVFYTFFFFLFENVLVIDHHEAEKYSEHACVINNQMCDYPTKSLSGAGVVYTMNTTSKYAYVITNYHVVSCYNSSSHVYYESQNIKL